MDKSLVLLVVLLISSLALVGVMYDDISLNPSVRDINTTQLPSAIFTNQSSNISDIPYGNTVLEPPLIPPILKERMIRFVLPLRKDSVTFKYQGIWPFGVQGGDYPFGNPGIDFEAPVGTPILASASGSVIRVVQGVEGEDSIIVIHHERGLERFDTHYKGPMERIVVARGDEVYQGTIIAYYDNSNSFDAGFLHFEIFQWWPPGSVCPVDFFTEQAKNEIKQLFSQARYEEQDDFPLLCNSCPSGGCR